ncbi:cupin domain-containing protein [Archangium lipolyticum]|uniref:cupin domain-containing protein n=1 Tax=Archangium lipolyticum TaxID=2970465 RepID=UPI00214A2B12|nr:cupin domain-containing protein [Archangium lipolyticum]
MSQLITKKFSQPDERRPFIAHGHVDVIHLDGRTMGLIVCEPGWTWSKDVQPIAGTKSCQVAHSCYYVSGSMEVIMDDGTRKTLHAGDVAYIPPGHDARVVGDEPCVLVDFEGMSNYAQREASTEREESTGLTTPLI